ncbi:MAG: hypothetical protein LAT67_09075 [Balneolales bacterium]|nr:hypothetical protein [Balneolales bacterium]
MKLLSVIILILGLSYQSAQAQQIFNYDIGFKIEADIGVNALIVPTRLNTFELSSSSEDYEFSDATAGSKGVAGMIRFTPISTDIFGYTIEGERSYGMFLQYEHNFKRITHEIRVTLPFGTIWGRYQNRDMWVTHYRRNITNTRIDETLYNSTYNDIRRFSLRFSPQQIEQLTLGIFTESGATDELPYPDDSWLGIYFAYSIDRNWTVEAEVIPSHPVFGGQVRETDENLDLRDEGVAFTISLRRTLRFSGSYSDLLPRNWQF